MVGMHKTDDSLPVDSGLNAALKLRDAVGALGISGTDKDGNIYEAPITHEQAAAAIGDARRSRDYGVAVIPDYRPREDEALGVLVAASISMAFAVDMRWRPRAS
jgi:hypothetical protein